MSGPGRGGGGGADANELDRGLPASVLTPLHTIERHFDEFSAALHLPTALREAIRYSFLGPGKRLRPLLVWHASAAVGGEPSASLAAATAVELVHAFSLVHDDLPALDNDDLRRGRPTLHRRTSEAMAVLAGDAMLTLAFEVLVRGSHPPPLAAALARELAAGTTGMIVGQVHDTLGGFPANLPAQARIETIHRNKTGSLIRAACRMGAMCGLEHPAAGAAPTGTDAALAALTRFGESVGLMFQVVDDLLDVTQSTHQLGKRAGKDQHAGKLTYPGVLGADRAREEVRRLLDSAIAALAALGTPADPLRDLARFMAVRTR